MNQNKNAKEFVHELYNDLAAENLENTGEIKEVLLKVYGKLDNQKDAAPLVNRLVNYLYFTGITENIQFTPAQNTLITALSQIGKTAGLRGAYRADYGDKNQF